MDFRRNPLRNASVLGQARVAYIIRDEDWSEEEERLPAIVSDDEEDLYLPPEPLHLQQFQYQVPPPEAPQAPLSQELYVPAPSRGIFSHRLRFNHLDGETCFGDMDPKDAVCPLATVAPETFKAIRQFICEMAPDAMNIVPFEVGMEGARTTLVWGPCQSGKTKLTIASAWWYYAFTGCVTFVSAWRFVSSPKSFVLSFQRFNRELLERFGAQLVQEVADRYVLPGDRPITDLMTVDVRMDRTFDEAVEFQQQVVCQLGNPSQLQVLRGELERMRDTPLSLALGRNQVILALDEGDDALQSKDAEKYKKEQSLYDDEDGICSMVAHVLVVSATLWSQLIVDARINLWGVVDVVLMDYPEHYMGLNMPTELKTREITRVVTRGVDEDSDMLACVTSAMDKLSTGHPVQLAGRVAVALIVPQVTRVSRQEEVVSAVDAHVRPYIMQDPKGWGSIAFTFNGTSRNVARVTGIHAVNYFKLACTDLLQQRSHFKAHITKERPWMITNDDGRQVKGGASFELSGGSNFTAQDAMEIIYRVHEYAAVAHPGFRLFGCICGNSRVGRSVSFKDHNHVNLHLTQMFIERDHTRVSAENLVQAMHRIAGVYNSHYFSEPCPVPLQLELYASAEVFDVLDFYMDKQDEMLTHIQETGENPLADGAEVVFENWLSNAHPKLSKPQINKGLSISLNKYVADHTFPLIEGMSVDTALLFGESFEAVGAAATEMARRDVVFPNGSWTEEVTGVSVVRSVDLVDFPEELAIVRSALTARSVNAQARACIARLLNLPENRGIHAIKNAGALQKRFIRPRTRVITAQDTSRAVFWLQEGTRLVCIMNDTDIIREQYTLRKDGKDSSMDDGVKPMAYLFIKEMPALDGSTEDVKIYLSLDLPTNIPCKVDRTAVITVCEDE